MHLKETSRAKSLDIRLDGLLKDLSRNMGSIMNRLLHLLLN